WPGLSRSGNRGPPPFRPSPYENQSGARHRVDQRDEEEFAEYFAARLEAVRRTAFMLCGDWHRADDLAQTAFVALHRRWKKIRDRAATDAYVRRTLVRASIDESRRPWRRERQTETLPEPVDDSPGLDDLVATREDPRGATAGLHPRRRGRGVEAPDLAPPQPDRRRRGRGRRRARGTRRVRSLFRWFDRYFIG